MQDETLEDCRKRADNDKNNKEWLLYKGCLHKIKKHRRKKTQHITLVVPKKFRESIMECYHDSILAGHLRYYKTAQKISQWYWWPNMHNDIKDWCSHCVECQQNNRPKENLGKLVPIIATRPFQIMEMDIMTCLQQIEETNPF